MYKYFEFTCLRNGRTLSCSYLENALEWWKTFLMLWQTFFFWSKPWLTFTTARTRVTVSFSSINVSECVEFEGKLFNQRLWSIEVIIDGVYLAHWVSLARKHKELLTFEMVIIDWKQILIMQFSSSVGSCFFHLLTPVGLFMFLF